MSNLEHIVESDGYTYRTRPLEGGVYGHSYATLAFYAHFAKAFQQAEQEWEKMTEGDDEFLKYADSSYLYSMTLAMDGIPVALVTNVDDIVQVFPFDNGKKIGVVG